VSENSGETNARAENPKPWQQPPMSFSRAFTPVHLLIISLKENDLSHPAFGI